MNDLSLAVPDVEPVEASAEELFDRATVRRAELDLRYAGAVTPPEAWQLVRSGAARLIDVRTAAEFKFVGHVPEALLVPWAAGTALTRNPRFVRELESKVAKDRVVLFLCRSGKRSALAAEAAARAGYPHAFNILEGFEGDLDDRQQRGGLGGWRRHGLPWVQD